MCEFVYHYYERKIGPFVSLSEPPPERAQSVLDEIQARNHTFAAQRPEGYLQRRAELERLARRLFMEKGGSPLRAVPHYMVVEACPWLESWYVDGAHVKLRLSDLNPSAVSFTYGDLFPTFSPRVTDGREYRGKVYTLSEMLDLVRRCGLPQRWNPDGLLGPERYVEAQVWTDDHPIFRKEGKANA